MPGVDCFCSATTQPSYCRTCVKTANCTHTHRNDQRFTHNPSVTLSAFNLSMFVRTQKVLQQSVILAWLHPKRLFSTTYYIYCTTTMTTTVTSTLQMLPPFTQTRLFQRPRDRDFYLKTKSFLARLILTLSFLCLKASWVLFNCP